MHAISVVIPAHNEADNIVKAVESADAAVRAITSDYEIIVVDDGSADATSDVAKSIRSRFPAPARGAQ